MCFFAFKGFVTTTRVTYATPSALYAHYANRDWECDANMPKASNCTDIASQLIRESPGKNLKVIMGGGRQCLQSNVTNTDKDPIDEKACKKNNNTDLIKEWIDNKNGTNRVFISNMEDLKKLNSSNEYVLGNLFDCKFHFIYYI